MIGRLLRPLEDDIGAVSQYFGENPAAYARFGLRGHNGVDYACPMGSKVLATHAGVVHLGYDATGYGHYIYLVGDGVKTCYAHLSSILVAEWVTVPAGAVLGLSGGAGPESGNSTGWHLHFGLKLIHSDGSAYVNPGFADWVNPCPWRGSGR